MISFSYKIDKIFIMLGFSCNFSCKYCLQHEQKCITKVYNTDIILFIKNHNIKNIYFYGGEPLLYFDIIKNIVQQLESIKDINFNIITNGSLLTKEIVTFLLKYNFNVGISWDGRNTSLSRGVDVFKTNKENIFSLKNGFTISGVLNKFNSVKTFLEDVNEINNEFKEETNSLIDIKFNLDCIHNPTHSNDEIYHIDYTKIETEMKELTYNFFHNHNKNSSIENQYIQDFINKVYNYEEYNEIQPNKYSNCGNGTYVLNINLDGNLYLCHNDSTTCLGNIYSSYDEYVLNYIKFNKMSMFYKKYCKHCSVRFICDGGCMLCDEEERINSFCLQNKAMFEAIIEGILAYK